MPLVSSHALANPRPSCLPHPGNYYVTGATLSFENAQCIVRLLAAGKGADVVKEIKEISLEGRAAKQDAGVYALAMCARLGDLETRRAALAAVPDVCRTGTTLFDFVEQCQVGLGACQSWSGGKLGRLGFARWGKVRGSIAVN